MNLSRSDVMDAEFTDTFDCPIARLLRRNGFPVAVVSGNFWMDRAGLVYSFSPTLQQLSDDLARETDRAQLERRPANFSQFVGRKVSL